MESCLCLILTECLEKKEKMLSKRELIFNRNKHFEAYSKKYIEKGKISCSYDLKIGEVHLKLDKTVEERE